MSNEWNTPRDLAALLGNFDLDVASNESSHIHARLRCQLERSDDPRVVSNDGLAYEWPAGWSIFANWPYSNPLPWAIKIAAHQGPWVVLCKLDPSCRWFAKLMEVSPTVAPFRKRIKFEGEKSMTANFPSALIYSAWRPSAELASHLWLPTYARAA